MSDECRGHSELWQSCPECELDRLRSEVWGYQRDLAAARAEIERLKASNETWSVMHNAAVKMPEGSVLDELHKLHEEELADLRERAAEVVKRHAIAHYGGLVYWIEEELLKDLLALPLEDNIE